MGLCKWHPNFDVNDLMKATADYNVTPSEICTMMMNSEWELQWAIASAVWTVVKAASASRAS